MILLFDYKTNRSFSYQDLINLLNNQKKLCKILKYNNDLYAFLTDFIFNIINNNDFELIDGETEIKKIEYDSSQLPIVKSNIVHIEKTTDLIELIRDSTSNISIFTSGTTGEPKKITHNIQKFISMVKVGDKYSDNIWAFLYNPTHMAGIQVLFQSLLNKNTIVNLFGCSRIDFINHSINKKITNVSATPTFYRLLSPYDFTIDTIYKATLGGEKSDIFLIQNLKKVFPNANILNIYATSEAGTIFTSRGDLFKIAEYYKDQIKIINNELFLHNKLLGNLEEDEWYKTGDIIEYVDENKTEFKITSRSIDFINIGGNRVNLSQIESAILLHNEVVNTKVYSLNNSVLGKIIACDILTYNSSLNKSDIKLFLKQSIPEFMIPMKINFVEQISTTRTGKIKKTDL